MTNNNANFGKLHYLFEGYNNEVLNGADMLPKSYVRNRKGRKQDNILK